MVDLRGEEGVGVFCFWGQGGGGTLRGGKRGKKASLERKVFNIS